MHDVTYAIPLTYIHSGDKIISINGTNLQRMTLREVQGLLDQTSLTLHLTRRILSTDVCVYLFLTIIYIIKLTRSHSPTPSQLHHIDETPMHRIHTVTKHDDHMANDHDGTEALPGQVNEHSPFSPTTSASVPFSPFSPSSSQKIHERPKSPIKALGDVCASMMALTFTNL